MAKLSTLIHRCKVGDSPKKTFNCEITPDIAAEILERYNNSNRPLSRSLSKLYANELLRGAWDDNGENIIFSIDDDGEEHLASGQHRLAGLVLAQQNIDRDPSAWPDAQLVLPVCVTCNVSHSVVDSVDRGKPRSHTDVLFRSPVVDDALPEQWNASAAKRKRWCSVLATSARIVWQRQGGKHVSSAERFCTSAMLDFIADEHPSLPEWVTTILDLDRDDGGYGGLRKISISYIVALSYLACLNQDGSCNESAADEVVDEFLLKVAQGTGEKGTPAHAIQGFWNSLPPGSKNRDLDVVGPFVKCLNKVVAKEDCAPKDCRLTAKEKKEYKDFPPIMQGWDEVCFEEHRTALAEAAEAKEAAAAEKAAPQESDEQDAPAQDEAE